MSRPVGGDVPTSFDPYDGHLEFAKWVQADLGCPAYVGMKLCSIDVILKSTLRNDLHDQTHESTIAASEPLAREPRLRDTRRVA